VRRTLALALLAAAPFTVLATPADACTGVVCNTICDVWNSKIGQLVVDGYCPLN